MSYPINEKRRCYNCKFYYRHDKGYSNYTVEDTEVSCLLKMNPKIDGVSEGYEWETDDHEAVVFAEQCDRFSHGEPLHIDVDEEAVPYPKPEGRSIASFYSDDPEVIAAFISFEGP